MTIVKVILKKLIAAVINLNIYYGQYLAILFGKYIKNVRISKSKNERKALLIYITLPFKNINLNSHPNLQEARVIADVLCDLGFSVDVMDYRNNFYVDVKKYYLVIGFGDFYERTFFEKCNANIGNMNIIYIYIYIYIYICIYVYEYEYIPIKLHIKLPIKLTPSFPESYSFLLFFYRHLQWIWRS